MSTETSKGKHPATKLPLQERVDYMTVVAAMAAADGELAATEVDHSEKPVTTSVLAPRDGRVIAAAERPDEVHVKQVVARLRFQRPALHPDDRFVLHGLRRRQARRGGETQTWGTCGRSLDYQGTAPRYQEVRRSRPQSCDCPGSERRGAEAARGTVAASLGSAGSPSQRLRCSAFLDWRSRYHFWARRARLGSGNGVRNRSRGCFGVGSFFGIRWLYKKLVGA